MNKQTNMYLRQLEIDTLFVGFYADRIAEFRSKYGVAQFDGKSIVYDDMLPADVREFVNGGEIPVVIV